MLSELTLELDAEDEDLGAEMKRNQSHYRYGRWDLPYSFRFYFKTNHRIDSLIEVRV
jgi:hypothetical protein